MKSALGVGKPLAAAVALAFATPASALQFELDNGLRALHGSHSF